jgi:hypothetical protein
MATSRSTMIGFVNAKKENFNLKGKVKMIPRLHAQLAARMVSRKNLSKVKINTPKSGPPHAKRGRGRLVDWAPNDSLVLQDRPTCSYTPATRSWTHATLLSRRQTTSCSTVSRVLQLWFRYSSGRRPRLTTYPTC